MNTQIGSTAWYQQKAKELHQATRDLREFTLRGQMLNMEEDIAADFQRSFENILWMGDSAWTPMSFPHGFFAGIDPFNPEDHPSQSAIIIHSSPPCTNFSKSQNHE